MRTPAQIPDAKGINLKPDPSRAQTPSQFMDALRTYRIWCGEPSYRKMAAGCRQARTAWPIREALVADDLPKLDTLRAILDGLQAGHADVAAFVNAWHRLQGASLTADLTGRTS